MRRTIAMLLATLLLLSCAAVAEDYGFNETGYPIVDEEITVTCLFPRMPDQPTDFSDMWFVKKCRDELGINIEYQLVEKSAFDERKALVLASDDYPDVFFGGITAEDEQLYGGQGIFIDLSGLIDRYAPNFKALMEQYPEIETAIRAENGAIYSMPVIYTAARDGITAASWMNMQWIENVGMETPATLDDLYDLLVAFRDQDANGNGDPTDEIPVSYPADSLDFQRSILAALGIVDAVDDVLNGQYVYVPMTEQYKEYLKYMKKLYTEDLLDKDVFILSAEEYGAKLKNNLVGIGNETTPYSYGVEDYEVYGRIPVLTSDINTEPIWPGNQYVYRSTGNFVITDKCEYPEAMVRLVDYFFTTEGSLMVRSGPEQGTWDGEGGWKVIKDEEGNELYTEITYDKEKYTSYWGLRAWNAPMSMPYNSSDYMGFIMLAGDARSAFAWETLTSSRPLDILKINYPLVVFTQEEQDTLNITVDLQNYVDSMEVKFITGEADIDAAWDEYVATLQKMGVDDVIAVKQAAYERVIG